MIIPKNDYLLGLERLFKKYGISVVYSSRPCTGGYQFNEYYVPCELTMEARDELMLYSMDDSNEDNYGMFFDSVTGKPRPMKVFYDGQFYGRDVYAN